MECAVQAVPPPYVYSLWNWWYGTVPRRYPYNFQVSSSCFLHLPPHVTFTSISLPSPPATFPESPDSDYISAPDGKYLTFWYRLFLRAVPVSSPAPFAPAEAGLQFPSGGITFLPIRPPPPFISGPFFSNIIYSYYFFYPTKPKS